VKRFTFTLARVRDFRRQQLEIEEAKLQKLLVERHELEAESSRLQGETSRTRTSLMVTRSAEAQELVAADLYLQRLGIAQKSLAGKIADWQARARQQQSAIVEARRRVRLLEKLEKKQLTAWKQAADRTQENLSAELFRARWKKP
jgi:flagellar export protein FliJ